MIATSRDLVARRCREGRKVGDPARPVERVCYVNSAPVSRPSLWRSSGY